MNVLIALGNKRKIVRKGKTKMENMNKFQEKCCILVKIIDDARKIEKLLEQTIMGICPNNLSKLYSFGSFDSYDKEEWEKKGVWQEAIHEVAQEKQKAWDKRMIIEKEIDALSIHRCEKFSEIICKEFFKQLNPDKNADYPEVITIQDYYTDTNEIDEKIAALSQRNFPELLYCVEKFGIAGNYRIHNTKDEADYYYRKQDWAVI